MRAFVFALLVTALTTPMPGLATEPTSEADETAHWEARYRDLERSVAEALARLEPAEATLACGRHHLKIRGEYKVDTLEQITRAKADLGVAVQELRDLPERARRAGASAKLLVELEDRPLMSRPDELSVWSAQGPEQHRALAGEFRHRAARLREVAAGHDSMARAYETSKMRSATEQARHCKRIAELDRELADQYDRLADGHESEAEG